MDKIREELKPCPFCGHEAGIGSGEDGYFINCTWCSASTDIITAQDVTKQEAIEAWNKRSRDEEIKNLRDALEEIVEYADETGIRYMAKEALKGE